MGIALNLVYPVITGRDWRSFRDLMRSENGEPLKGTDSDAGDGETTEMQALPGKGKEEDPGEGISPPADNGLMRAGETCPNGDNKVTGEIN